MHKKQLYGQELGFYLGEKEENERPVRRPWY